MHLAGCTIRSSTCATFRATAATAARTTARLINQALLLVKLLFACGKCEIISTVAAFEGLVYETQNQGPPCDVMVFSQVHILSRVTSSVTPSSAGLNVLDEHCIPDRDWIPLESIHYPLAIIKSFCHNDGGCFIFLMKFLCAFSPLRPFLTGMRE